MGEPATKPATERAFITGPAPRPLVGLLSAPAAAARVAHHPEIDQPLGESMPGGAPGRYRNLSAWQFAARNPNLCLWVACTIGGRAGRLCAEAMAVRAGVWGTASERITKDGR